eukprot:6399988-Pyramimonas_sp.AAC.3
MSRYGCSATWLTISCVRRSKESKGESVGALSHAGGGGVVSFRVTRKETNNPSWPWAGTITSLVGRTRGGGP